MRVYGQWAGNTRGRPEDLTKCVERIYEIRGFADKQCGRSRGYGPDKEWCWQHAKKLKEEKE